MMYFVWISFIKKLIGNQMSKKKLTCHCGGVEGQVEVPETDFKKLCGAIVLYAKEKVILLE